jgi:predicted acetyltransferase
MLAVTWVGVMPTHRRRGAMSGLLEAQLAAARERGLPLAGLWASEVAIYGRFGFGPATSQYDAVDVERRHGAFARPFADDGRIRLAAADETAAVLPAVHERARLQRSGDVSRPDFEWSYLTAPKRLTETFVAVHEDAAGTADGYALYKIDKQWTAGVPGNTVQCEELTWATPQAHAALWRFLLDIDLVANVRVAMRPLDEPVRWLLADPRRAGFGRVLDGLWLALLDVPAALAARSYAADGALVVEVDGRVLRLEAAAGGASCEPTQGPAELVVSSQVLAAAYLGGHRFAELAQGGLVEERAEGALRRADVMFQAERVAWCSSVF